MKKNKLWILLIIFIGLFVFKVDGVFADGSKFSFEGCTNYVEENVGNFPNSESPNLLHCADPGFIGWTATLRWTEFLAHKYTFYCEKDGKFVEAKDNIYGDNTCTDSQGIDHSYLFNDKVPNGFNPNNVDVSFRAKKLSTFTIQYEGCSNLSGKTQDITIGKSTTTKKCTDSGFLGWHVEVVNKGWYCIEDGDLHSDCGTQGKKIYSNGASVTETGDNGDTVIFHAVTQSNTDQKFTIQFFDGVGGKADGSMSDQEVVIGVKTNIKKNAFKRENYKFAGWTVKVLESNGNIFYYCADGSTGSVESCNDDHGGFKVYSDGAQITQTGTAGSTVQMTATWKVAVEEDQDCFQYHGDQESCESKGCSYNTEHGFCNVDGLTYLSCGDAKDIPEAVPGITSFAVTLLKTVTPIVLIIVSVIQLVKALISSKEDEIKKAQASLIKKGIAAVIIFFVITIVQFIILKVADSSEKDNLSSCLSCFLNGTGDSKCGKVYFKDGYGKCFYTTDKNKEQSCDSIK